MIENKAHLGRIQVRKAVKDRYGNILEVTDHIPDGYHAWYDSSDGYVSLYRYNPDGSIDKDHLKAIIV